MKPTAPKPHTKKRVHRPAPVPVVLVQKKKSGVGGGIMLVLLLLLGAGAYFVHYNKQQNEEALAAKQARLEQNAKNREESERLRAERDAEKAAMLEARRQSRATAMGAAQGNSNAADEAEEDFNEEEEEGIVTAMGSTTISMGPAPEADDATEADEAEAEAAVYDLTATGSDATDVAQSLNRSIQKTVKDASYQDLLSDLKSSLDASHPELYSNESSLPALAGKDEKLLQVAQSVYTSLMLASDIEFDTSGVAPEKHEAFQAWLLADKAKVALAFTQALDQNSVKNRKTAAKMMAQLRDAYVKESASAAKKIKSITKKKKK